LNTFGAGFVLEFREKRVTAQMGMNLLSAKNTVAKYQKKSSSAAASQMTTVLSILLIVGVIAGGWALGRHLGWWGATGTSTATGWTFTFTNSTGDALDDDEVLGYLRTYDKSNIANWDNDDFNALAGSDLTLETSTIEHGERLVPQANHYYFLEINGSGYNTVEIYLSAIELGDVEICMLPTPTDCDLGMLTEDGDTAAVNMTGNNLRLFIMMVDADEDVRTDMGYRTTLEYSAMTAMEDIALTQTYNIIRIECNTTIADGDIELDGATASKVQISSVYIYFCFTQDFVGMVYYDFDLSSNLGSTFEVVEITFRTGTIASNTEIAALA
jgi:hypothetical protein